MAGVNGAPDMVPIHKVPVQTSTGVGEALVIFNPTVEGTLPHPVYMLGSVVMSDDQVEALRRQISVYSTICKQLVDMHKATTEAQSSLVGVVGVGQHNAYDAQMGTPSQKTTARQRWTPSQSQLLILEKLFDQGNGTPNKQRIKEITAELSHHGQIAETNVYNWFQNRKARAKRKQQAPSPKDGESEIDTDNDSPKDKKPRLDRDSGQEYSNSGGRAETGGHSSDGNGAYEQKPINVEQESASSGHLQRAHSEPKQATAPATFGRSVSFNSGYTKSGTLELSQLNMLADGGKRLDIPAGVLDLKSSFPDSALMMESHVPNIRAPDSGITFPGLHAAEAYRLSAGLIDGGVSAPLATDAMQVHNIHQVVGLLNNGLGNGSVLRMQAQI